MTRKLSVARQLLRSLVLTALTTLVAYIVQEALSGKWPPTSRLLDGMVGNSKHDAAIMDCIVRDVDVGVSRIGGMAQLKEELHTRVVLPLSYPKVFFDRAELTPPRTLLFVVAPVVYAASHVLLLDVKLDLLGEMDISHVVVVARGTRRLQVYGAMVGASFGVIFGLIQCLPVRLFGRRD